MTSEPSTSAVYNDQRQASETPTRQTRAQTREAGGLDFPKLVWATRSPSKRLTQPQREAREGKGTSRLHTARDVVIDDSLRDGGRSKDGREGEQPKTKNEAIVSRAHEKPTETKQEILSQSRTSTISARADRALAAVQHEAVASAPSEFHVPPRREMHKATVAVVIPRRAKSVSPVKKQSYVARVTESAALNGELKMSSLGRHPEKHTDSVQDRHTIRMAQHATRPPPVSLAESPVRVTVSSRPAASRSPVRSSITIPAPFRLRTSDENRTSLRKPTSPETQIRAFASQQVGDPLADIAKRLSTVITTTQRYSRPEAAGAGAASASAASPSPSHNDKCATLEAAPRPDKSFVSDSSTRQSVSFGREGSSPDVLRRPLPPLNQETMPRHQGRPILSPNKRIDPISLKLSPDKAKRGVFHEESSSDEEAVSPVQVGMTELRRGNFQPQFRAIPGKGSTAVLERNRAGIDDLGVVTTSKDAIDAPAGHDSFDTELQGVSPALHDAYFSLKNTLESLKKQTSPSKRVMEPIRIATKPFSHRLKITPAERAAIAGDERRTTLVDAPTKPLASQRSNTQRTAPKTSEGSSNPCPAKVDSARGPHEMLTSGTAPTYRVRSAHDAIDGPSPIRALEVPANDAEAVTAARRKERMVRRQSAGSVQQRNTSDSITVSPARSTTPEGAPEERSQGEKKARRKSYIPTKREEPVKDAGSHDATSVQESGAIHIDPRSSGYLRGCLILVDVRNSDGEDSSAHWVTLLESAGATVRVRPSSKKQYTHIVFKSGRPSTTHAYRDHAEPKPLVVGVQWVLKCNELGRKLKEDEYLVEMGKLEVFKRVSYGLCQLKY